MDSGEYQERLYFRLTVCQIEIPPLRNRTADLPFIVGYFLKTLSDEEHIVRHVAPDALDLLMRYPWPGNLPQLRSIVHRSLLATRGDTIEMIDLPPDVRGLPTNDNSHTKSTSSGIFSGDEVMPLREIERMAIAHALSVTGGSVGAAARRLGIGRATLYRRLASFETSQDVA
jgi:DNA-binding NtrC family response regulator